VVEYQPLPIEQYSLGLDGGLVDLEQEEVAE
jgi:hypothetical protein